MTKTIDVDEAFKALRQYYYQLVRARCVMFLEGILDLSKHGEEPDADTARENLSQIIDAACIYHRDNAIILAASDNDDAYVENLGSEGIVEDGQLRIDRLAFAALEADMNEELDRAGFDWWDPEGSTKKALEWFQD